VTDQQIARAAALGKSAGEAYKATGVSRRNPFAKVDDDRAPLRDAWTRAYVDAAYKRHQ
jgi:hypothetical protein